MVNSVDLDQTAPLPKPVSLKTWISTVFSIFSAHWFLAIICYPGEDDIAEVNFIPKPHTAPLPPELAVPTPPEPRDDEEDMDMDEMDSEVKTQLLNG